MEAVMSAIIFLNWERNLAYDLGMTHGQMKDLVMKQIIKPFTPLEEARKILEQQPK